VLEPDALDNAPELREDHPMSRTKHIPSRNIVPMVTVIAMPSGQADQLVTDVYRLRSRPGYFFYTTLSGTVAVQDNATVLVLA
jgi:hypothetical protein